MSKTKTSGHYFLSKFKLGTVTKKKELGKSGQE